MQPPNAQTSPDSKLCRAMEMSPATYLVTAPFIVPSTAVGCWPVFVRVSICAACTLRRTSVDILRHLTAFSAISDDARRDQNNQLGLVDQIVLVGKGCPHPGMSPSSEICVLLFEAVLWIMPPSANTSPSFTTTVVLTRRCWIVGELMLEEVVGTTLLTSCSISSWTRPLSLIRGVTDRMTPVSCIVIEFTIAV